MEQLAKERAEKLKDAERLAVIGATAGMVGHDIRNPLQAIVGELYLSKGNLLSLSEGECKVLGGNNCSHRGTSRIHKQNRHRPSRFRQIPVTMHGGD
jgi:signal transduction histidine kinase